jgi:hypothetical protein
MKSNLSKYLKILLSVILLVVLLVSFTNKDSFNFGDDNKELVAKVGSIGITTEDLKFSIDNAFDSMTNGKKSFNDLNERERLEFKEEVLKNLINEKLMMNFAKDIGMNVDDSVVVNQIKNSGIFSNPETGVFDKDRFNEMLKQMGKSEREYIDMMKQSLSLFGLFVPLSIRTDLEIPIRNEMIFKNLYTDRIVDLIRVKKDDLHIQEISDEKIKKYYDDNKEKFKTSEFRASKYLILNKEEFKKSVAENIKIDKAKVQEEFKNQIKAMPRTERRTFYNVVCSKEDDGLKVYSYFSNLDREKFRASLINSVAIKNIIKDNLKITECNVVEINDKQIMEVPEVLRKAAFDNVNEINKVSKPEKTDFGYQIVILKNIKQMNADDLKHGIEDGMKDEIAENIVNEKFMKIGQEISEGKVSIDDLSKKYNLPIKYFDYVDDDGYFKSNTNKYIAEDYIKPEYFSRDVLNEIFALRIQDIRIVNSNEDYIVISLDNTKPIINSHIKPLYEIKFEIKDILINSERELKASEIIEHIYADYKNGMKESELEEKYKDMIIIKDIRVKNPDLIRMSDNSDSVEYFISSKIFDKNNKDSDAIKIDNNNEIAILKSWSEEKIPDIRKKEIVKMINVSIQNSETNEIFDQIFDKLKDKYKIKIYDKELSKI